jgi:tRNA(fMet)-specific endonuclease VapC
VLFIALFAGEPSIIENLPPRRGFSMGAVTRVSCSTGRKLRPESSNLARLDESAKAVSVLPCDSESGLVVHGGKVRLSEEGPPDPGNDVWIAAVAGQHDLTLLTRDGHFREIEGLRVHLV